LGGGHFAGCCCIFVFPVFPGPRAESQVTRLVLRHARLRLALVSNLQLLSTAYISRSTFTANTTCVHLRDPWFCLFHRYILTAVQSFGIDQSLRHWLKRSLCELSSEMDVTNIHCIVRLTLSELCYSPRMIQQVVCFDISC
jgi:hypothetical protein